MEVGKYLDTGLDRLMILIAYNYSQDSLQNSRLHTALLTYLLHTPATIPPARTSHGKGLEFWLAY